MESKVVLARIWALSIGWISSCFNFGSVVPFEAMDLKSQVLNSCSCSTKLNCSCAIDYIIFWNYWQRFSFFLGIVVKLIIITIHWIHVSHVCLVYSSVSLVSLSNFDHNKWYQKVCNIILFIIVVVILVHSMYMLCISIRMYFLCSSLSLLLITI